MPLAPGARLGMHEIVGLLGAGGMGEVYLAQDTKLNRRVAIKVLPEAYAGDPDRIARFHREAQAVASLNHTGIAAIYDLQEAEGTKFLVLELVDGETLADRLQRGAVPVEEALQIAKQILEALEAAHERGVCHRDLKPANIKLTPDGAVKILDFGLAKFLQNHPSAPQLTHSPTLSLAGTYPGVILGTAGYMSPEQAKGFEADHRSDIFSFGCILYELLTGRQAFEGETASEVLASVLKSEVDWNALPARLNPRLVELLRRCLEKNPKKRWHAAADVRVEIEGLAGRGVVVDEARRTETAALPKWKLAIGGAALAAGAAVIAASAAWTLKPEPPQAVTRFVIALPEGQQFSNTGLQLLSLSPDGANLVYVADNRLFLRPLDALHARAISGTETPNGIQNPVFSPDGEWIAYRSNADGFLKRIAASGGAAISICQADSMRGMHWHETGIVFGQGPNGILRVSPNGGVSEVVARVAADETANSPQVLPGGRVVLFSKRKSSETWDQGQIVAQPLDGRPAVTVMTGGADARYLPTGQLAYAVGGVMMAVPFDLDTLTVRGGPVPVIEGVRRAAAGGTGLAPAAAHVTVSQTGSLAYVPGPVAVGASTQADLALFDRKGEVQPFKLTPAPYAAPRVSRDGRSVAFESSDDKGTFVSVYELASGRAARRLTFDGASRAPIWSPDGQWIAYESSQAGGSAIFRIRADGAGTPEALTKPEAGVTQAPQSWSPDGQTILFSMHKDLATSSLWLLTLAERRAARFGDAAAREAAFSPDGRWVVYAVAAVGSTNRQVFVEPFPRTGARYLLPLSTAHPFWTAKGDAIISNTGPTSSHITAVFTSPRFAFGQPAEFPRRGRQEANPVTSRRQVDAMPDGEHVIGVMSTAAVARDAEAQAGIVVVLNWLDEVRQRVPVP